MTWRCEHTCHFGGPHWLLMGLLEISRITWQVCVRYTWNAKRWSNLSWIFHAYWKLSSLSFGLFCFQPCAVKLMERSLYSAKYCFVENLKNRWATTALTNLPFNSLAPRKFEWNFRHVIFKQILVIDGWGISCEIALIWMSLDLTDDQSTLVQVMAWCRQATSHYLSQCWPRSLSPYYGITRPQWVMLI